MAASTVITINHASFSRQDLLNKFVRADKRDAARQLKTLFTRVAAGIARGTVKVQHSASAMANAAVTVQCTQASAVDGTDVVVFLGVTLAVVATPANQNQFLKGASDIAFAANLAAAINAHTTLLKYVSAASDGVNTVTVTMLLPGALQNFIPITETGNGFTLGAALFAGGTGFDNGTVSTYAFGV